MIERPFAEAFADEWIAAWNSRDLDRILSHYTPDFEFSSPLIPAVTGDPGGRLKGQDAIRAYWHKAAFLKCGAHAAGHHCGVWMLSIALVRSTKEASGATNAMTATSFVDTKVVLYTIGKEARKSSIARG